MRSVAAAIAWEVWSRKRVGWCALIVLILAGGLAARAIGEGNDWTEMAGWVGYVLLTAAVTLTYGCSQFTEGQRKAGFGSFPVRLFNLPVSTRWLVALPMLYGCAAVVAVYLGGAWLMLAPLGRPAPVLWPCLYLVFGFSQFQMILWSLPKSRYLKLLCLSFAAAVITFSWMFFLPQVIEGTLSVWGYAGRPEVFLEYLFIGLVLAGPAAYLVSLERVRRQRQGRSFQTVVPAKILAWIRDLWPVRRETLDSVCRALFWQEWRQTVLILPLAMVVVLVMVCLPAGLSGPLSGWATMGLLCWVLGSPLLLAGIIGIGMGKPDFWSPDLELPPFMAVRPFAAGQWVLAKLKVAMVSVMFAWVLVYLAAFLLVAHAGDLEVLDRLYGDLAVLYSPERRWLLLALLPVAGVILTWRFLVSNIVAGLSGRKRWYVASNLVTTVVWILVFVAGIWRTGQKDHAFHLYSFWSGITWLPAILGAAVCIKVCLGFWAWRRVHLRRMLGHRSILGYLGFWVTATLLLAAVPWVTIPYTVWLRDLAMLLALLAVPLTRPALATLALADNRSR